MSRLAVNHAFRRAGLQMKPAQMRPSIAVVREGKRRTLASAQFCGFIVVMPATRLTRPLLLSLALSIAAAAGLPAGGAGGDRALGAHLAGECVTCHLPSGRQVGGIPAIVGWPETSFIAVMQAYAARQRDHALMQAVAAKFTADELAALAAYFGSLKPP
jgi:cytochrome c553